jgi:Ca2+-binding RTX toxin-like protein
MDDFILASPSVTNLNDTNEIIADFKKLAEKLLNGVEPVQIPPPGGGTLSEDIPHGTFTFKGDVNLGWHNGVSTGQMYEIDFAGKDGHMSIYLNAILYDFKFLSHLNTRARVEHYLLGGQDGITGTKSNDVINGYDGNDALNGAAGNDTLIGGNGDDNLGGSSGNDTLDGGKGADVLVGGGGADRFIFSSGYGFDQIRDSNRPTAMPSTSDDSRELIAFPTFWTML